MEIPEKCRGCETIQAKLDARPASFNERIAAKTGVQVVSASAHYLRFGYYPPDVVNLEDGTIAPERVVSSAWYGAKADEREHNLEIEAHTERCPGVLDAETEVMDTIVTVKVCGKTALDNYRPVS